MTVEWTARMISPARDLGTAPLFRRTVRLEAGHGPVTRAELHASALGVFEARVNGRPVGDDVLSPGWSSYEWRLRYRTYDVRALLEEVNVVTVLVGNGWHRGRLGFAGTRAHYGPDLGALAQLEIGYADGHRQVVATDETWTVVAADVLTDDLYDGQTIDARRRDPSWFVPDSRGVWELPARVLDFDVSRLTAYLGPPVTRQETLAAQRIWHTPSGRTLVDFGQNLVGWVRFAVQGPRGGEIRIRHAEVLDDAELGTRPLRDAQATDRFILSGGLDRMEPTFTFHGFRYAEVSGWPGELTEGDLEAVVVHSAMSRTGHFACSDDRLTQLHHNALWSAKGNLVDLPTDCPQRNERLGWTGDFAVFAPAAAYLFDVEGVIADWLVDLAVEQAHSPRGEGMVPFMAPDVMKLLPDPPGLPPMDTAAVWSDAAVWVPWELHRAYADRALLERQYPSMTAHVRRVARLCSPSGLWEAPFQFGDWLDPDAPPDQPWAAKADKDVVATACLYRSADLLARIAELLGTGDAEEFRALADRTRSAFREHYVGADGRVRSDCATVYALAIRFGLLEGGPRQAAGDRLAELVREAGHHISTGFAGTPYVTDALASTGHLTDAYGLLMQTEPPSWLYAVTMGATTIWERWDSMLPDGSINPGEMTSFNHYAFGAVADFLHRVVGGLAPEEPGYATARIAPRPGGGLTWAETSLESRHGRIAVRWDLADGRLVVTAEVPDGVSAILDLPGLPEERVGAGSHRRELGLTPS